MSFLDKLGDAWNATKGGTAAIGRTFVTATDAVRNSDINKHVADFDRAVGLGAPEDIGTARQGGLAGGIATGAGAAASGMNTAFGEGVRPASTMFQMFGKVGDDFSPKALAPLFTAKDWADAWGKSDPFRSDSEPVSYGQAVVGSLHGIAGIPEAAGADADPKARDDFYHNTAAGKIASGAIDLAVNLFGDPVAGAGAGFAAARKASTVIKAADISPALRVAAGDIPEALASRTVNRKAGQINGLLDWTHGKTAAEIYQHPAFKANPEGGTFASLFEEADRIAAGDKAAADASKRTLLGAALGDKESIDALRANNEALADQLYNMSVAPANAVHADRFSWGDHGQGLLFEANASTAPEALREQENISREIERLNRVIDAAGSSNVVGATLGQKIMTGQAIAGLRTSTIYTGPGSRPIMVVGGQLGNRLEGHVSLRDPVAGYKQLNDTLKQAPYLAGTQRRDLLDKWVKSASDDDRQGVVREAESVMFHATADHYGVSPTDAATFLKHAQGRRTAYMSTLESRLYSAAEDHVSMVDPDTGLIIAKAKPLMQSQIEDFHPLVDPKAMDRVVRAGAKQRLFEKTAYHFGDGMGGVVTKGHDAYDTAAQLTSSMLQVATRVWKDSMLLPRTVAYMARTQIDTQGRLMTHMHVLNWMSSVPSVIKSMAKYNTKLNPLALGDMREALLPQLKKLGVDESEYDHIIAGVLASQGSHADLASELSSTALQKVRANGQWGRVEVTDDKWAQAWQRAVQNQVMNSPTAMKMLTGASDAEMRNFVLKSRAGQKEWLELSGSHEGDLDGWLSALRDHVDHYVPLTDMRIKLLDGKKPSGTDIEKWFGGDEGLANRMVVHGEGAAATKPNALAEAYHNSRERLYTLISDAPETLMGRMPLYVHSYQRNLKGIVGRLEATSGEAIATDSKEMMAARKQAGRMARREIGQVLFDSSHTSNLAHTFRFVAPFWGAWEDMMRKWGGLFYNHPDMAERLRQGWEMPANLGMEQDEYGNRIDAQGNHVDPHTGQKLDPVKDAALIGQRNLVTIPLGWVPKREREAFGIGDKMTVDKQSFNIIFQGDPWWLPGFGPIVQIPANAIVKKAFSDQVDNPIIQALLPMGTTNDSVPKQLLPAWAKRIVDSGVLPLGKDDEWRKQASIVLREEYIKWENGGRQGPPPTTDSIAGKVKNYFLLRALTGVTSPVTMMPSNEMQFYIDQAHVYRQKFDGVQNTPEYKATLADYNKKWGLKEGKDRMLYEHPEYQGWMERFRQDFPQYFDLAVSVSTNESGLVATARAESARKKYAKEIAASDGKYAWVYAGPDNTYGLTPDTKYSDIAHDAQGSTPTSDGSSRTLRQYDDPATALAKAEAQKGWAEYMKAHTRLNLALEQMGATSLRDPAAAGLKAQWNAYTDQLAQYNQYWAADFQSRDEGKAVDLLNATSAAMKSNPSLAKRQDMQALQAYTQARTAVMDELAKPGLQKEQKDAIHAAFDGYAQQLIQWSPGFEQIYSRGGLESDNLQFPVAK